jgi:hypothetical protein
VSTNAPDIGVLAQLPEIIHTYGNPQPPIGGYWMSYIRQQPSQEEYKISFLRHAHNIFPTFITDVTLYLTSVLARPIMPSAITIMRTIGSVPPHIDEARKTCVNIGLHNTTVAMTVCHDEPEIAQTCCDNCAYLLDVSKTHSVRSFSRYTPRYLVSYGMTESYDEILTHILTHGRST